MRGAARGRSASSRTADIKRLETNLERQRDAHAAHDVDTFYILDEAFHQALVEHSGFPGVWRVAQRAKVHLNRARRLSLPEISTIGELIDQHATILEHIAAQRRRGRRGRAADPPADGAARPSGAAARVPRLLHEDEG